ncbi:unnamed protein product [Echinostoma caproni]|uniref:Calpain catalytic domain-containing protein n=1 Tax=Echinostoma caproni TaxID=27848 RepID=A0A3P8GXV4_9TREM|nr:unnamed protein product [Echinostoma caproni]
MFCKKIELRFHNPNKFHLNAFVTLHFMVIQLFHHSLYLVISSLYYTSADFPFSSGQSFDTRPSDPRTSFPYCGMFWFRFWQFGDWYDVVIDDRLPTQNGRLVFLHSSDRDEFWSALLEKAYVKLFGTYEAMRGGSAAEAMEDFTGGLTELVDLGSKTPENLFTMMERAHGRASLMACSIDAIPNQIEAEGPLGLIMGHAYSVTAVCRVSDPGASSLSFSWCSPFLCVCESSAHFSMITNTSILNKSLFG